MEALKQLLLIMNNLLECNQKLLGLAKEKKKLLIENNIQELHKLNHQELVCVDELQKLENRRVSCVKEYMSSFGITGKSFSLEELLDLPDQNIQLFKAKLIDLAAHLRANINEISHINENNQQLIQNSLSYLDYSMGILVPKEPSIGYGPKAAKRYSSLLDAKI